MKRSCKHIDILDAETVYPWVLDCILRHKKRHDFQKMLHTIGGMSRKEQEAAILEQNTEAFFAPAWKIAEEATHRIRDRNLMLPTVRMQVRVDRSSGKERLIGCESAMQQVFDYIAVYSCNDIWRRRIVPQQASSIPGRGQVYGMRMIKQWVQSDNRAARWAAKHKKPYFRKCKYFVKLDIRKCYQSMRLEVFLDYFRRDCGNEDILWLWETLLRSHRVDGQEGFLIGALVSQWACQYLISFLYRHVMELHKIRRDKKIPFVTHCGIYMDDILLTGCSRRNLEIAVRDMIQYADSALKLEIKSNWHIQALSHTPMDMMGYVVWKKGAAAIRPRVFLRARRAVLRILRRSRAPALALARRVCSYKGYFKHTNSQAIWRKLRLTAVFQQAANIVRYQEWRNQHGSYSNIQRATGSNPVYAFASW